MGAIESIMDHIASELKLDPVQLRQVNTSTTKYPKIMDYWKSLHAWADIKSRKKSISTFNKVRETFTEKIFHIQSECMVSLQRSHRTIVGELEL